VQWQCQTLYLFSIRSIVYVQEMRYGFVLGQRDRAIDRIVENTVTAVSLKSGFTGRTGQCIVSSWRSMSAQPRNLPRYHPGLLLSGDRLVQYRANVLAQHTSPHSSSTGSLIMIFLFPALLAARPVYGDPGDG
jgi:hypothetical protein